MKTEFEMSSIAERSSLASQSSLEGQQAHAKGLYLCAFVASLSSFTFGYNIGIGNKPLKMFANCTESSWRCFRVTENEWSLMSSMLCVGALVGSLAAGVFATRYGRLWTIKMNNAFYIAGLLSFGLAANYWMLFIGRTLVGVGVGVACVVVPMYLTELSPLELRGVVGLFHQMALVLGIVVVEALGLLLGVEEGNWRLIVLSNVLLLAVQTCLLSWCHESSKWTSTRGAPSRSPVTQAEVCAPVARKSLALAVFLHVAQQASGVDGIFFYSSVLFTSEWVPVLIALLNAVMTVVAMGLMERSGRRPLLLWSLSGMTASLLLLCSAILVDNRLLSSLCILAFIATFAVGLGPIPWLMMSELFPTEAVGTFVPLAVSANWLSKLLVTGVFLPMKNAVGLPWLFGILCLVSACLLATSWLTVVETKGRPASYLL